MIALEHERPGANRLLIDVAGASGRHQVVGVLGGEDRGEAHGQVLHKRGIDTVEGEHHCHRPSFFNLGNVLVQAHADEVGELGRVVFAKWVLAIKHAVEGEQHVVSVELTAGGKVLVAMKLHAFTQLEGIGQPVGRHLPAFGQRGLDGSGATLELDQTVIDRLGGVVVGGAGVLRGVKTARAAFGAEHQVLGLAQRALRQ
ncbi:hypothetical protein D3C72_1165360 [compost metagenome]